MKQGKIILILSILSILGTFAIYSRLPDQIPVHWGIDGHIDRYGNRIFAFLTASIPLLMYGLYLVIPKIDPRKDSYEKHSEAYSVMIFAIILFTMALHWMTMGVSLGVNINIVFLIKLGIGILFIIIGNYLPVVKHNYTLGIRTPWTLADEKVWEKTHRVGGYSFVITGLLWGVFAFVDQPWVFFVLMGVLGIMITGLVIYSYVLFKERLP